MGGGSLNCLAVLLVRSSRVFVDLPSWAGQAGLRELLEGLREACVATVATHLIRNFGPARQPSAKIRASAAVLAGSARPPVRVERARADSSRNAMFSAAQIRQTTRFARFSASRRCKTSRFAMFSGPHIRQTPRCAMLSAPRLAKHSCFARFAAMPGWAFGVLGGLRRLARALLLQCWLGLRSHLLGGTESSACGILSPAC